MGAPKSRTGLLASIEVETADWYAGLKAVRPHAAKPDQEIPILTGVHVRIDPDGNAYLMATDRYTAGIAIVSIWEDHLKTGEVVEFDLSPEDVAKIHPLFKPKKGGNPEDRLRLDIGKDTIRVTEVIGMIETAADTHHQLLRTVFVDAFPAVDKLVARCLAEAMGLRERAESTGKVGDAMAEEIVAQAAMFGRFDAAASAYGEQWAISRTREARSALLITVGESFLGVLMPIKPSPEETVKRREWQQAWVRRLPGPDETPVAMHRPAGDAETDAEFAGIVSDLQMYVDAPDDGTAEPGDRLSCTVEECGWVMEVSIQDPDAVLSEAVHHVMSAHSVVPWAEAATKVRHERLRGDSGTGEQVTD